MIDRIITLTTLLQAHREFRQPMWIAYIDLKAAFDSVDRVALWVLLLSIGIPRQIVDLMKELYTDTMIAVRVDGMLSDWFRTVGESAKAAQLPQISSYHPWIGS